MERLAHNYYLQIERLLKSVAVTDHYGNDIDFCAGIAGAVKLIKLCADTGRKLLFIGNGASAAVSSHQATDFWKNAGIRAMAFNDISGLTCISNDFGYEHVFEKPIEMFAEPADVLVAISSSGQSENILRGVSSAAQRDVKVITLSGFERTNPLRELGLINFYVPSPHYGHVEILHLSICHCILDIVIHEKSRQQGDSVNSAYLEDASVIKSVSSVDKPKTAIVETGGGQFSFVSEPQRSSFK